MIWLCAILVFVSLLLTWLLIAPVIIEINSSEAFARLQWRNIGYCSIYYNGDWYLEMQILFYHRQLSLSTVKKKTKKKRAVKKSGRAKRVPVKKIVRVIKSFTVKEWELAIDSNDYPLNACLYPLNFLPGLQQHVYINFSGQNYLHLKLTNRVFYMLRAFLR